MINRSDPKSTDYWKKLAKEKKILLEKYQLEEFINEGGFGAVFKSTQFFFEIPVRHVAVKVSKHKEIDLNKAKDIFSEEILLAGAMEEITDADARCYLTHVYEVGIADIGLGKEKDLRAIKVMEFVRNKNLSEQFESFGIVPSNLLLKWTHQICRAMSALHNLVPPLLHRDLKPDNILLGMDNNIRVVDFGLAAKLTKHGIVPGVAGTFTYMAPETMMGESEPASDVYSIGLILYEGLTGKRPFERLDPPSSVPKAIHNEWIYSQKSTYRLAPPSYENRTVPRMLDEIVMRCLEFNPSRRFHNAGELLIALKDLEKPAQPDVAALEEGRELKTARLDDARRAFEKGLALQSSSRETRLALMRELGEVFSMMGNYKEAVYQLEKAWEFVKGTTILRTREERAELLQKIADFCRKINPRNDYKAGEYEELIREEKGEK